MEQTENKQPAKVRDYALIILGVLAMLMACLFFAGSVALDVVGEKAIGELSNAAMGDCPPNKTCWTGRMDFTTKDGEQVTFYPMTNPILLDLDNGLSGRPYEEYGNYDVRYLESFPQIAKVNLVFFLEYLNMTCGLCGGAFILLLAYFFSSFGKNHKPIVIDLSKRNK